MTLTNDIRTIPSPTPAGTAVTVTPKRDSCMPMKRHRVPKMLNVRCQRGDSLTIAIRVNHTDSIEAKKSLNWRML